MRKKNKVLIGMSGGVDSSVAAYLLKEQGYEVIGATIRMTDLQDTDAKEVCKNLDIEHIVVDKREIFKKEIINYFLKEYKLGKTPNPCTLCNRKVKFQTLLEEAKKLDCNYVATGHYAKVVKKGKRYLLKMARDKNKDQSYVLYNLTQEQLSKCMFPLGNITKKKVRSIAKVLGLIVAEKKDSQEICFVKDNNYSRYIEENSNQDLGVGNIIDMGGNILGKHKGIHRYTIGQRKGIGISSRNPLYIIDIDAKNNRVIVGRQKDMFKDKLIATNINLMSIEKLDGEIKVDVKIRYSPNSAKAKMSYLNNGNICIKFTRKQRAVTPGQAVVFYKKDIVIGGGIIV